MKYNNNPLKYLLQLMVTLSHTTVGNLWKLAVVENLIYVALDFNMHLELLALIV